MSTNVRAVRYRRLALAESDAEKARLLQLLADEAERGVHCTATAPAKIAVPPLSPKV